MPTPDGWDERAVPGDGAVPDSGPSPGEGTGPADGPRAGEGAGGPQEGAVASAGPRAVPGAGPGAVPGDSAPSAVPRESRPGESEASPGDDSAAGRSDAGLPGLGGDGAALAGEIPFRPLSISEMLDGAIACVRLYPRAVLAPSVVIATVTQVAGSLAAYFFVGRTARDEVTPDWVVRSVGTQFTLGIFGLVLSAFGIVLLAGLLGPVLGRGLFGSPVSLRGAWRDTRPRLGRLFAVGAVITVVPLLGLALPVLPFALLVAVDAHPALGVLSGMVGFPAGIALMVWLYVLLVLAAPAVVMERESVGGALRRARTLSKGRWWRTFGTLLLAIVVTVFMGFFALRTPFLLAELIFFGEGAGGDGGQDSQAALALAVDTLGRIVSWSVVLPFDAGVIALLYIDRRMRREGFDLELRTRVHERTRTPATAPDARAQTPNGTGRAGEEFFEHWRPDLPPPPSPARYEHPQHGGTGNGYAQHGPGAMR